MPRVGFEPTVPVRITGFLGLFSSSGILGIRKHDVSETGSTNLFRQIRSLSSRHMIPIQFFCRVLPLCESKRLRHLTYNIDFRSDLETERIVNSES
jgi:hypothetical protein